MPELKYRTDFLKKGVVLTSIELITTALNIPFTKLRSWNIGETRPRKSDALDLFKFVDLRHRDINDQLKAWGYAPINQKEFFKILNGRRNFIRHKNLPSTRSITETAQSIQASQDLQNQIKELEEKFSSLSSQLEQKLQTPTKGIDSSKLSVEIDELRKSIEDIQETSQQLAAPVILPNPKDMQVTLVSSASLDRLEEYRSEENKWFSVLTLFLGSILGIMANVATGGSLNPSAYVVVIVFALMTVFSGWSAFSFRFRANEIRNKIFSSNTDNEDKSHNKEFSVEIAEGHNSRNSKFDADESAGGLG